MSMHRAVGVIAIVGAAAGLAANCTPFRDGSGVVFESSDDTGADGGLDVVTMPDMPDMPDIVVPDMPDALDDVTQRADVTDGGDDVGFDIACPQPPNQTGLPPCEDEPPTAVDGCTFAAESGCADKSFQDLGLCEVDLGSDFRDSEFSNVRLDGARASDNARFSDATFQRVSMVGFTSRSSTEFDSSEFVDVDLSNSQIEGDFDESIFRRVLLDNVMLGEIDLEFVVFQNVSFTNTGFFRDRDTGFINVTFVDSCIVACDFSAVELIATSFTNVLIMDTDMSGMETLVVGPLSFDRVVLRNVDLSGTLLLESWLGDIVWDTVICPDGTNSADRSPETCVGHLEP